MKDTEFKKIIDGVDLSTEEGKKSLFDAINKSEDSLTMRKESSFNEKYSKLETEYNTMKTEMATLSKSNKEMADKSASIEKENGILKNKNYIYQNVNNKLNDKQVNEFMGLVNLRLADNSKLKFEDAVKGVSADYGTVFNSAQPAKAEAVEEPKTEEAPVETGVRAHTGLSEELPEDDNSKSGQMARFKSLMKNPIKKS